MVKDSYPIKKFKIWDFLMNEKSLSHLWKQRKKLAIINGILASVTFVSVKVVGQERKWVDLADND